VSCGIQSDFEYKLLEEGLIKDADNMTGPEVRDVVVPALNRLKQCNEV